MGFLSLEDFLLISNISGYNFLSGCFCVLGFWLSFSLYFVLKEYFLCIKFARITFFFPQWCLSLIDGYKNMGIKGKKEKKK